MQSWDLYDAFKKDSRKIGGQKEPHSYNSLQGKNYWFGLGFGADMILLIRQTCRIEFLNLAIKPSHEPAGNFYKCISETSWQPYQTINCAMHFALVGIKIPATAVVKKNTCSI